MGKIIDGLLSAGVYTRTEVAEPLLELTEHFMERELSCLPALEEYSKELLALVHERCVRAADAYLVQHPDYS